jgi:hypothetical protein
MGERKMLNNKRTYLGFLALGLAILCVGFYMKFYLGNEYLFAYLISYTTVLYLILEKSLGYIFFKLKNREPEFSISSEHWSDIGYTAITTIGTFFLPVFIHHFIVQKILSFFS